MDGLLAGGPHYRLAGQASCVHHTFTLLAGFIGISFGYSLYINGGLFVNSGNICFLILGALASCSDVLMRLTYQKYKSISLDLQSKGIIDKERDIRTNAYTAS